MQFLFQSLLETAHAVETQKLNEIKKLDRQVKYLTREEAANLVSFLFIAMQGMLSYVHTITGFGGRGGWVESFIFIVIKGSTGILLCHSQVTGQV